MTINPFDEAFEKVGKLVEVFRQNQKHYLSALYSEADARKDFIDKFWIALGWDVNHETQTNPYEQEVKVERSGKGSERRRRADYAFLAPNFRDVRFYVEAKKPSVELENKDHYFQTIRYGWNSQTPLGVLTDFEQFHILDCRYKPDIESALLRVLKKYHYSDYTDSKKFAEIYHLFSREAVLNNSIEKYAEDLPKPTGKARQQSLFTKGRYQAVDESFLQKLDEYREELARSFKNKNPQLGSEALTEITQRTLDRLVFIRFLEDKLIETEPIVENFGKKGSVWQDFIAASSRLDRIYNGIIFKKHEILDAPEFRVDERSFDEICENLSHENSPYDFNAIPLYILGSIYERFLGKTIVATEKRARVEEKPEVRKAGGVYYTPEYIVRYIVENTVGKLVEGKKPDETMQMRFVDIACGSGSFLLGVYDLLLRHHTTYYNANKRNQAEGLKAGCREHDDGTLHLSLWQRREILLNNIYGVDIDAQAVEVAQLSLYLKMLEDETTTSARSYQLELREALLPSLNKNIVCGNSLIGWDINEGRLFEAEEERKLNPMNYAETFPHIMKAGGFDAIVGNPPYVRMESFKPLKAYLRKRYTSHDERSDLYIYFIERANKLLNENGRFGVIVSNKFLRANYGAPLRRFLEQNTTIDRIVDFAGLPVFAGATVRTIVLLTSRKNDHNSITLYTPPLEIDKFKAVHSGILSVKDAIESSTYEVAPSTLTKAIWSFSKGGSDDLLDALKSRSVPLVQYCDGKICMGVKSGLTEAFVIDSARRAEILQENPEAQEIIKPFLNGRDVRRYQIEPNDLFLIYTYHGVNIKRYPVVEKHLEQFKQKLSKRATKQAWYELQQPQLNFAPYMDSPKIIFPDIAITPRFAIDENGHYGSNTTYFIPQRDFYLLSLLNSQFGFFYFSKVCAGLEGKGETYLRFFGQYLAGFPVRAVNLSDKADKLHYDKMIQLVEQMMATKNQRAQAQTDKDKAFYESKCAALDGQIDRLVYELYNLNDEEIAIIESK